MTKQINKAWWNNSIDELEQAADSDGVVRNRTEERRNRFNGESVMLTKEEAKKHDEIFLHEVQATLEDRELGTGASKHWQKMRDKLSWFMKHNAKAYMVLLD
jgi:hypothetical protein